MQKPTFTLLDLIQKFPDEKTCHQYLAAQRWMDGEITCPHDGCGHDRYYVFADGIRYKCKKCKTLFTAKTNTFMEASKLPTLKWILAMYLVLHKKGISSVQLAKDIGVQQRTAWFILQRLRTAFGNKEVGALDGIVEIDESFVGGKNKNRHYDKKVKYGVKKGVEREKGWSDKVPVMGFFQRGGILKAHVIPDITSNTMYHQIRTHVVEESVLMTDEYRGYECIDHLYAKFSIEHGKGIYAQGDVTTNRIENFWSHMKRCIFGIYIQVSHKHLNKYVQECVFRFNYRNLSIEQQIDGIISNMNCRLKYKDLIAA